QGGATDAALAPAPRPHRPLQVVPTDADLTPEFPGITDRLDIRAWNPPFPYESSRIQKADERYWEEYRTAAKAYVTLAAGQKLWGSRFGDLTSIRLAPASESESANWKLLTEDFRHRLLEHLRPEQGGLVFDAVRQRGLAASSGFTDFGVLFLLFS